jgi:hypothetical protein
MYSVSSVMTEIKENNETRQAVALVNAAKGWVCGGRATRGQVKPSIESIM